MRTKIHFNFFCVAILLFGSLLLTPLAAAKIIEDQGRTFLIDQTGERWDITQAVSIGFEPRDFEFGIGRNAFRPLSESDWSDREDQSLSNFRVIGVSDGKQAHAYAVSRLSIFKDGFRKSPPPIQAGGTGKRNTHLRKS